LALPFQPTIGTDLLPMLPVDAVRNGVNAGVDLLAGTNLNEGSFFTAFQPVTDGVGSAAQARRIIETDIASDAYPRYVSTLAEELDHEPTDAETLESALTDRLYRPPTNRLLDARLQTATGRTFSYLFTWPSPMMDGKLGSCHALEAPFVFRQLHRLESATLIGDNPPKELSEWMSGAWVEFARRGAPQSPALPDWPEYDALERRTMILDRRPVVASDPRGALRKVWSSRVPA
jgi:para-nitrobenzyl esterase